MSKQSSPSLSVRLYKTRYTITNSERESLSGAVHLRGSQRLQLEKWTKKLTGVVLVSPGVISRLNQKQKVL
ncbi:hypothetical protein B0O99DRAFT_645330 [Bisporella sp. PMI_857]|nr:hypothetical protein B0O99DRAFT_645330 [Bisporella sp. PMI_857]